MSSSEQRSSLWAIVTAIVVALCVVIAIPDQYKSFLPEFLKPDFHLGLDLAGGTQLDFRISEDEIVNRKAEIAAEIEELKNNGGENQAILLKQSELQALNDQHANLVEAIRTVLERRINSLGVSEATITPSYFGSEKHLLVECPGVIDVDRCIATVGKTIQLEFKEEFTGVPEGFEAGIRAQAEKVYQAIANGTGSLMVYGQDLSNQLGVSYFESRPLFVTQLPKGMESIANRTPADPVVKSEASVQSIGTNAEGQQEVVEIKGIYLTKVLEAKKPVPRPLQDPQEAYAEIAKTTPGATVDSENAVALDAAPAELRTTLQTMAIGTQQSVSLGLGQTAIIYLGGRIDGGKEMTASHVLIQYKGAERAEASVTRTKEQAKAYIDELKKRLDNGESFTEIASKNSDGPSRAAAGSIGVIRPGLMPVPFETAAFALGQGQMSGVVETPFGYHIIRADSAAIETSAKVTYELLTIKSDTAAANLIIDKVEKGEVTKDEDQIVIRGLFFSLEPTGWKDTELNGQRFRTASVTVDPVSNIPVVQIQFDQKGGELFQELTKRNIGKSIAIFVGGDLVSAPTVQGEIAGGTAVITGSRTFEEARTLAQDLNTGAIPAPIYLSGQSTVEATLGATALEDSVFAALVGFIILCFFLILVYRVLGVVASLALVAYIVLLVASTKLPLLLVSNQHVVLTLAGIAGIILSMGMAVDANVLAFERIKEELTKGKTFKTAVETGFKKAWPSVRDGNLSTLITCAILFMIGTSIIRGFAITLTIGIFISLFTGILVSRWLCRQIALSPLAERLDLFGIKKGIGDRE
ncbi:MAG: protein translocase subunit SecD [Candidatus Peribacteraceae bacterium]|nr:protein translocase subunit SecD [Candidatus Peribacteraceae bacterium]